MATPSDPWYWAALGNPYVSGSLGWVGLALTLIGFGIAIKQLMNVKRAANAARDAAVGMAKFVRTREQLLHLNSALATLESARGRLGHGSRDAASLCIDLSITAIIAARELSLEADEGRRLRKITVSLRQAAEQLDRMQEPIADQDQYLQLIGDLRSQEDDIKVLSAKSRYAYPAGEE